MFKTDELETQAKLAKLQADIQIYLTTCFALFTLFITAVFTFQQLYLFLPKENPLKVNIAFSVYLAAPLCFVFVIFFLIKAFDARKQIEKIRKRYEW